MPRKWQTIAIWNMISPKKLVYWHCIPSIKIDMLINQLYIKTLLCDNITNYMYVSEPIRSFLDQTKTTAM